ncbi:aminotransferase, class V [Microscilla marina ATCC 23134]|uniref:Probable cysteine desulfurase n=2 Tax=Microscilla marina TaxID=1027 RepID=A1ZG76_MICM2|nr:aminotransferase, class V [Microscilla marina ATCC 23134]
MFYQENQSISKNKSPYSCLYSYCFKTEALKNQNIMNTNTETNAVFDINKIREDFPLLTQIVNGKPLVYLDNAATTQKPKVVLDALNNYYLTTNANIHRGAHYLASKGTQEYEATRETVRQFLNAASTEEVVFVRGVTEAINLVASTFGRQQLQAGDEVIISTMEHHSNIVPWQLLCEEKGAHLKIIPITDEGELIIDEYEKLLNEKTKIVSIVHASNSLGTVNPVKEMIAMAHKVGAKVLVDGAQASVHLNIDVQDLNADFYAFSGHKVYAPTGIGALYGKKELLEAMPPYHGGGEMIKDVTFEKTTFNDLPHKFEAGTPNIADGIAFKQALDYIATIGKAKIAQYEEDLLQYASAQLQEIEGLKIIGTAANKVSVISFIVEGVHHNDIGILLDTEGIAIRTGHHCTQPLMNRFNILGTSRVSFAMYNTKHEVDTLIKGLHKALKMLR